MKAWSTIVRSVRIPVNFDNSKVEDDDYLDKKEQEILEKASKEFGCPANELIISDSDIVGLVE